MRILKNLSSEVRQMITIARVLTYPVKLVIIDKPTVSLTYPYQQRLLRLIQEWSKQGVAVLFSGDNLDHLFAVTDRIITLHQGSKVADVPTDETNRETIVANVLGTGLNDQGKASATILDFDNYDRIREQTEELHYHQMLLEKDLASQDALNRQLVEQLTKGTVQALDLANQALQEAHRRLLSESKQERKHLARELHDQVIQLLSINYQLEGIETEQKVPPTLAGELLDARSRHP